jgi:GT2 family glycosyltransferase
VRFSVLIVTYRRPEVLEETLRSILACDPSPDEILVIDGDAERSAEPVVEKLDANGTELRYLTSPPSLSIQRNRGMKAASGDVFVFLDDDVRVAENLFGVLAEVYADPGVVGATGTIVEKSARRFGKPDSSFRHILFPGGAEGTMTGFAYPRKILDPGQPRDVEWMQGCFTTARAVEARRVRFDENITAEIEGEDEDFGYRLSRRGRIRFEPRAVVEHKHLGFKTKTGSRRFDRDIVVVRTYLFRKNFARTLKTRAQFAGLIGLLLVHRLVNREWRGALGILDGVAYVWQRRGEPLLSPERTRALIGSDSEAPTVRTS